MTDPQIPQLQWPLAVRTDPDGSRRFVEVPQDSLRDIQGCAGLLCELRRGQLPWSPEVGITDPLGSTDPDTTAALIERDLRVLEPRPAGGITVRVLEHQDGPRTLRLKVNL